MLGRNKRYITLSILLIIINIFFCSCTSSTYNNILFTNLTPPNDDIEAQLGHTQLLSKSNNKLEYLNKDGTKSIYLYSSPIYTDDGNIINNSLIETQNNDMGKQGFKYQTANNNITTYFPDYIGNGILIDNNSTDMWVYYDCNNTVNLSTYQDSTDVFGNKINSLKYDNVLSTNESIVAYSTQFGLSTEIDTTNIQNIYKYKIKISGCYADASCPEYIIFKNKTNDQVKAIIYSPFVKTSEDFVMGKLELLEENNDEYTIQNSFSNIESQKYLNDQFTILQSFCLYTSKKPDSSVYENIQTTNSYLSQFMLFNGSNGSNQTYVRFEDLNDLQLETDDIISAKYYVHNISSQNSKANIFASAVIDDWCSSALDWTNKPRFDTAIKIKPKILDSGDYEFNITELVKKWNDNKASEDPIYSIRKGIVLYNSSNKNSGIFASNDNGLFGTVLVLKLKS